MIVFWLPVLAGVLAGLLLGGRLGHLATLPLRYVWLLVLTAAAQIFLVYAPPVPPAQGIDLLRLCLPLATAATGVFVLLNRRLPGMWLVLVGVASNLAVITANGGLMPTNTEALTRAGMAASVALAAEHPGIRLPKSKDIVLEPGETRLWWLSDVLVTPPLPRPKVLSVGDLIIASGIAYLTAQAVRGRVRSRSAGPRFYRLSRTDRVGQRGSFSAGVVAPFGPFGTAGATSAAGSAGSAGLSGTLGLRGAAGAVGIRPTIPAEPTVPTMSTVPSVPIVPMPGDESSAQSAQSAQIAQLPVLPVQTQTTDRRRVGAEA